MSDAALHTLLAKQEIRDQLSRYCRGLDRMDKEMAYGVWHPDGTAHYFDTFEGSGRGFVDWVWEAHAAMERHSHQITNVLIEVEGDTASSEAYVIVALWRTPNPDGSQTEVISRGRYLDRWSKRDGRWAIDERLHVVDVQNSGPIVRGGVNAESSRTKSDPSFAFIPEADRAPVAP